MKDPLRDFDWSSLYDRYDAMCSRFNPEALHLRAIALRPPSDRDLYYHLADRIRMTHNKLSALSIDLYEAMLYWKLYSNPQALAKVVQPLCDSDIRAIQSGNLKRLFAGLPPHLDRNADAVVALVKQLGHHGVLGMKTATALPARTTFLHFLFPEVVPIFDKMVLKAVGRDEANANHNVGVLCEYLLHAWALADRYTAPLPGRWRETSIRLIDMALWVARGEDTCDKPPVREPVAKSWQRPGLRLPIKGASLSSTIIEERRGRDDSVACVFGVEGETMNREQILEFVNANPLCHLATCEGMQPRVRGMMLYRADGSGLIFHTGRGKALSRQLLANKQVEVCFNSQDTQVRVAGVAEIVEDMDLKQEIVEARPFLKPWVEQHGYDLLVVFRVTQCQAAVWTMATNFEPTQYRRL